MIHFIVLKKSWGNLFNFSFYYFVICFIFRVPDYIKYARPDDDTDPTPYYLRENKCDEVKEKIIEKPEEKEKSIDASKISVGERELEILEEIDEKSKLVIGEDSKEHLVILCGNERYLVLSEIITKDLKSCDGKFKVDPENIPISDHCREINIIITFDTVSFLFLSLKFKYIVFRLVSLHYIYSFLLTIQKIFVQ